MPSARSSLLGPPTASSSGERALPEGSEALLQEFLAGRSPRTVAAYGEDLRTYAAWTATGDVGAAIAALLAAGPGPANRQVLAYRAALLERGLAPATVNRRLAALRSLVAMARLVGLVPWKLEVSGVRSELRRDPRGPERAGFRRLLAAAADQTPRKAARDGALLHLLHDLGLRRAEVVALARVDVDLADRALWVRRKGRRERTRLELPSPTRAALRRWLAVRGDASGALFPNLDRAGKGDALTGSGLYKLLRTLGRRAGVSRARPHGLRHLAITTALEQAAERGIPIEEVLAFSGHAKSSVAILLRYRDRLGDRQGEIAGLVARSSS